jgi:hypothetical protein
LLLGGWGMATSKNGSDGVADVALSYQFHDHFSFEFGMRWLGINVKGEDIDYQIRNAWGPTVGIISNFRGAFHSHRSSEKVLDSLQ